MAKSLGRFGSGTPAAVVRAGNAGSNDGKRAKTARVTATKAAPGSSVCVIGLGYVGLPLAVRLSSRHVVWGVDRSAERVRQIRKADRPLAGLDAKTIREALKKGMTLGTTLPPKAGTIGYFVICVPTPLREDRRPDLEPLLEAFGFVAKHMERDCTVILESTSYPGTTRDLTSSILEPRSGLKAGRDFFVAYSPERIDPGNEKFSLENLPKLVGGLDNEARKRAANLYREIINAPVTEVSSPEVAEAAKLLENVFRNVNIAMINELSMIFANLGIDTWEVIEAAKTKPFGFMPFYPGPGVGGHCIPLDPLYLSHKTKLSGIFPRFIELSTQTNDFMPFHVVNLVRNALRRRGARLDSSILLVLGLSYKKNIADVRESPSIALIDLLRESRADVRVFDPYVGEVVTKSGTFRSQPSLRTGATGADCMILAVDHDLLVDRGALSEATKGMRHRIVVDTRNGLKGRALPATDLISLGRPSPSEKGA